MTALKGHGRIGRALLAFRVRGFRTGRTLRPNPRPQRPADPERDSSKPLSQFVADQLFSRVAGAERVDGNVVRVLRDGAENYPAWLEAIRGARRWINFENYIIRNDTIGREFADALMEKARQQVTVRVLYDWMGCMTTWPGLWRQLRRAGVEVRCFNPPSLTSPFGWLSRNHRKSVCVDGEVGYVAGLCVGQVWVGDPARNKAAWRDTGIELRGPAVADLDIAFAQSWTFSGGTMPEPHEMHTPEPSGAVAVRVIGSKPNTMGIYRLDQVIAAMARRRLWLTDAYFVGTTSYVRALCEAAEGGVDTRLLVPGASDLPISKALSRAGYRPLLESGVRVFEWNGPMLHAKTAVADGRWARIGSSNLNLASWMGNWELDVAIEDDTVAAEMEAMFEGDLRHATEIVLAGRGVHSAAQARDAQAGDAQPGDAQDAAAVGVRRGVRRGSPGRLAAGAVGLGSTVTAAITNHRALGPAEARVMGWGGALLLVVAVVGIAYPYVLTVPLALLAAWIATTLLVRAGRLSLTQRREPDVAGTPNPKGGSRT